MIGKHVTICMGNHCACFGAREILAAVHTYTETHSEVIVTENRCLGYCSSAPNVDVNGRMMHLTNAAAVLAMVENVPSIEMKPLVGCGCGGDDHTHERTQSPTAEDILSDNNFLGDL
jgi:hypothetical protein